MRTKRTLRRQRGVIAAIGLVTLAAFLSGCTPVPEFVSPNPVTAAPGDEFGGFGEQIINWGDCEGDAQDVQCASVYAPMSWTDVDVAVNTVGFEVEDIDHADDILLRLVKHPSEGGEPIGTLFVNPGGPGASGVDYVKSYYQGAVQEEVRQKYDVIGWDPRGVGRSSAVYCLDDAGLDDYLYGTGDPEEDGAFLEFGSDEWIERGREFGEACLTETGDLLGNIDTVSTVRDLDMLREIVGDEKLNFLGYSYGTQIGALYADELPDRVGRLVLDGAIDPSTSMTETGRAQAVGIEGAMRNYVADCLTQANCPLASGAGNVESGMQQIDGLLKRVEAKPIRASDGRMLYDSTLFTAIVATLYSPNLWPHLGQMLADVQAGGANQAMALADYYNDRVDGVYQTNLMEAFISINCVDYPREGDDFDAMRVEAAETIRQAPIAGRFQSFGEISCANWPVPAVDVAHRVTGTGAGPILIIGTTGDPATPYRWAESLADQLESGVLLTFEGEGHTAYGKNACVNAITNEYLLTGALPEPSAAVCR